MSEKTINFSGLFDITIPGAEQLVEEVSILRMFQYESILSAAAYTRLDLQDVIHSIPNRNYDQYKGMVVTIDSANPNILNGSSLRIQQIIYRMQNRMMFNNNIEQFSLLCCDPSLLNNAQRRMSNFYECESPSTIAQAALACAGATSIDVEESGPARNYQAANLHPYQVLAEQAEVALAGNDPSFLHYMTLMNGGTHHFRSLRGLTQSGIKWTYVYAEEGAATLLANPTNIMKYEFPCDFDLLGDMMNGLVNGALSASTIIINPRTGTFDLANGELTGCGGLGGSIVNSVVSDTGSAESCGTTPEDYMSIRQARMSLIQPDKITLKITVPYNPIIHAGDMIECYFINKMDGSYDYGSGEYLIVNMTNEIKSGGVGTSTMECVSGDVG